MKIPLEWLKQYIKTKKTPKELGEEFTALGLMLDKPSDGVVLDLEHRMDRADWLSILGCARDLAAYEDTKLIYPELYTKAGMIPTKEQLVDIKVDCPNIVKRFNTRVFRGIKVQQSPDWLKDRLETYGLPSINNIVDITNYVMVELGQPMHAQDLAKFDKQEIVIRMAKPDEKITTLHGDGIKLDKDTFVLTQNDKPIVIGGIVGGKDTGVTETTTDIILDAGNYDQVTVRKTSRRLKILNETVSRYDKFLHPKLTELAIQRATQLILELAGGTYYENVDWYPQEFSLKQMTLRLSRIKALSGMDVSMEAVEKILRALEYKVLAVARDSIDVEVPYFRTDVAVEDDLVSDVLRISDYKNIPLAQMNMAPPKEITPASYKFEDRLRDVCVRLGLHEHITDALVKAKASQVAQGQVVLQNSLNSEKDALRTTMYETLLPVTETYAKHKIRRAGVFEIGRTYHVKGDHKIYENYKEVRTLGIVFKDSSLSPKDNSKETRKLLAGLMKELGVESKSKRVGDKVKIFAGNTELGTLTYDAIELYTENLMQVSAQSKRVAYELPQYRTEDLSLIVPNDIELGELCDTITDLDKNVTDAQIIEEYTAKELEEGKKAVLIRITYINKLSKEAVLKDIKSKFKVTSR